MGRGNAVERAAKAKERLQAVGEAQAEIGRQALEAIEKGTDPELAVALATAAAKEFPANEETTVVLEEQKLTARATQINAEHKAKQDAEQQVSIRLIEREDVKAHSLMGCTLDGKPFNIQINAHGVAIVSRSIAEYLLKESSDVFEEVEQ